MNSNFKLAVWNRRFSSPSQLVCTSLGLKIRDVWKLEKWRGVSVEVGASREILSARSPTHKFQHNPARVRGQTSLFAELLLVARFLEDPYWRHDCRPWQESSRINDSTGNTKDPQATRTLLNL